MSEPLVDVVRAGVVEAIHRGDIAVVDATGDLRASVGDPETKISYWRSAAKPFQVCPLVSSGAADRWGFSSRDLALMVGSHNGERIHADHAAALLERIGCDVDDLVCGPHPPLDSRAAEELALRGEDVTALHNNCSGKHIGMLALARHLGADVRDYQSPDHPVQQAILESISVFADLPADSIPVGTDGCGVPCFATSVYHLAVAFARLAHPSAVSGPHARAAQEVGTAMASFPYLVAGRARLDTDLMSAVAGGLIAKGGASGVQCVGLPDGMAMAIKIEDGSSGPPPAPGAVATLSALHQLGVLDAAQLTSLAAYARPELRNVAGLVVGEARPTFDLVMH